MSKLHSTCENVHGVLGWVDWACSISCACLFPFKPRGIKKYSVPYMVQIELTYISIKSGVVNSNINGFFNCSGNSIGFRGGFL